MKKTMIALAAIAAVGAASAQVKITGGVDFTIGKSTAASAATNAGSFDATTGAPKITVTPVGSDSRGLYSSDAFIDISVSEDLGGGMKASSFMEFNADGGFQGATYAGDKNFTLSAPMGSLTLANTRTGGTMGMVLMAPVVSATDHWSAATAAIVSRSAIDAAIVTVPVATGLTVSYKYLEAGGAGSATPAATVNVLSTKYTAGPLTVAGDYAVYSGAAYAGDVRSTKLTAAMTYDAGVAKLGVGYDGPSPGTANSLTSGSSAPVLAFGVSVPLGTLTAGANYGKRDAFSFIEVGATYSLSKNTFVTASYGTFETGISTDSYGLRLGHSF